MFKEHWVLFTYEEEGVKLNEKKLIDFYISLPDPLGFGKFYILIKYYFFIYVIGLIFLLFILLLSN